MSTTTFLRDFISACDACQTHKGPQYEYLRNNSVNSWSRKITLSSNFLTPSISRMKMIGSRTTRGSDYIYNGNELMTKQQNLDN